MMQCMVKRSFFSVLNWLCHASHFQAQPPPIAFGGETLGQRVARIRKERGFTQVDLAEKIGLIQNIGSAEIAVRFAAALDIGMDELLKPQEGKTKNGRKQTALLRTIDT